MSDPVTIEGTLLAVLFTSDDGEFLVGRLHVDATSEPGALIAHVAPVVGPAAAPHPLRQGVSYRLHGLWETHATHGRQFRFASAVPLLNNQAGVTSYLLAVCPGVGEGRARRLWDAFGGRAVDTLRDNPALVVSREILTPKVAAEASQALHDDGAWQEARIGLMGLLAGRGFQLARVMPECIRRWRARAPDLIRRNPYRLLLAQIPSCSWARVDKLYLDLGHDPATLKRQALTLTHYLLARRGGDTWVDAGAVARDLVAKIPSAEPVAAMRLAERGRLVTVRRRPGGLRWLAPRKWAEAEKAIADRTKELLSWVPRSTSTRPAATFTGPSPDVTVTETQTD